MGDHGLYTYGSFDSKSYLFQNNSLVHYFFSNLLSFSAGDQSSPLSESLAELFAVP